MGRNKNGVAIQKRVIYIAYARTKRVTNLNLSENKYFLKTLFYSPKTSLQYKVIPLKYLVVPLDVNTLYIYIICIYIYIIICVISHMY